MCGNVCETKCVVYEMNGDEHGMEKKESVHARALQ